MRIPLLALLFVSGASLFAGKLPPFTMKEVSLMLRSGYSSEAVEKEVTARRVIDAVDPTIEKSLLQAGATAALVNNLRNGVYAVSEHEIEKAKSDLALREQRRAEQAREAAKLEVQSTQSRATAKTAPSNGPHKLAASIQGNLVTSKNGILQTYNNQALEKKKLIGLYFSAYWCGPCRKFTPELVTHYNRIVGDHPEFEIIFVSGDRSAPSMEAYMRDMQMPWPAVAFDKIAENEALRKYAGAGIPCLVLINADGQVVSDSYNGKTYLGPGKVLADLDQLLGGTAANQVALQR